MSCTIIDSKFIEDLSPHTLRDSSTSLDIDFGNEVVNPVGLNTDKLIELYYLNHGDTLDNTWRPIYVTPDSSSIESKKVNRNFTSNLDNKLGIEKFISFKPLFNNWYTEAPMCLDWFLTDDNFSFTPLYGILGWMRKAIVYDVDEAPINTIFKSTASFEANTKAGETVDFGGNVRFVKYSDDTLIDLSRSDATKYIDLTSAPEGIFVAEYGDVMQTTDGTPLQLYISEGDFFSYHENEGQGIQDYEELLQFSDSHISATIWKDYQYIFNLISKITDPSLLSTYERDKPDINNFANAKINDDKFAAHYRGIKKLSSILATHPLKDRITHDFLLLPEISETILNFVQTGARNLNNEKNAVISVVEDIFNKRDFTQILDGDIVQSNYKAGFINTKSDLFNKLINKYESYLNITGFTRLNCTKILPAGPHAYVNSIQTNHCIKSLKDSVLYNNVTFRFGDYTFSTAFSATESEYDIISLDKKHTIPLFDSGKDFELYFLDKDLGVTAGPDIYMPGVSPGGDACGNPDKFNGFSFAPNLSRLTSPPQFPTHNVTEEHLNKIIPDTLIRAYEIGSAVFNWEIIGAVGDPSDLRIERANTPTPTFRTNGFGKFNVQLTVTLDSLVVRDKINVYVTNETGCNIGIDENGNTSFKSEQFDIDPVTKKLRETPTIKDDAVDFIPPGGFYSSTQKVIIAFNRNRQGELDNFLDYRYAKPIILPNDRNICKVPNITELLFSKYGAVCPLKTNSYISVRSRANIPNDDEQMPDPTNVISRLDNSRRYNKFFYKTNKKISEDVNAKFSMIYNTGNTFIKLYRIKLEKLRDGSSIERCKSIYRNLSYETTTLQNNALNQGFVTKYSRDIPGQTDVFNKYLFNVARRIGKKNGERELYPMPDLSDYGVVIQPFGGNDSPFDIDTPGVTIENLMLPKSSPETVFGHFLNEPNTICFLREAEIFTSKASAFNYGPENPNIRFTKGTFHPSHGFVRNITDEEGDPKFASIYNKTSALKFNPGNRTTFSFKGPGFYNSLRGGTVGTSPVRIEHPEFEAVFIDEKEYILDVSDPENFDIHHGYRGITEDYVGTKVPKNVLLYDEFGGGYGYYKMGVRGRKIFRDERLYGSNLLFAKIKNMEVKLNFLNQINLKNVKIWIDFAACAKIKQETEPEDDDGLGIVDDIENLLNPGSSEPEQQDPDTRMKFKADPFNRLLSRRAGSSDSYPIISNLPRNVHGLTESLDDTGAVKVATTMAEKGMKHSAIANYMDKVRLDNNTGYGSYRLYLLNGETVDANTIDTTLHFSDRFSKNLTARNSNTNYAINTDQNVNTTNHIKLQPSLAAPEYFNHDEFIAAIKKNDLFLPVNSFSKFYNLPLFDGILDKSKGDGSRALPDSLTSVTLSIEVIHDHDMANLDVVSNLATKTDCLSTEKKQIADSIFNSLCSWDLIVHLDTDDFTPTDNLGQIKYGNWTPHIPGYNFISNDPNVKYKLPHSVLDAPNQKSADLSPCFYDEETDNTITPIQRPADLRFPTELIALALSSLALGAVGGLIGLTVGFGTFLAALAGITRFLSSIKRAERAAQLNAAFVRSVYDKRGYGGHDKILLQVGTNGPIVYDVEAAIYKYSNTPLLRQKLRRYVKTSQIPELANFRVSNVVDNTNDLFTGYKFDNFNNELKGLKINDTQSVRSDTLVEASGNSLYVSSVDEWQKLDNTNIPLHVLSENNVLGLDLDKINNMSLIPGTRAYNYFDVNQNVSTTDGMNFAISAKGTVLKNSVEYTVLQFKSGRPDVGSEIFIPSENNNNVIVWTDKESDHYNSITPATQVNKTLFPKGAYGNTTPVVPSETLSNQLKENDIPTIYDIFNNQECNVKPHNRIKTYGNSDPTAHYAPDSNDVDPNFAYNLGQVDILLNEDYPDNILQNGGSANHALAAGYSYNLYNILQNKDREGSDFTYMKDPDDDSSITFQHLLNNVHNRGSDNYNLVELKSTDFDNDIAASGYIEVEGDYQLAESIGLSAMGETRGKESGSVVPTNLSSDADALDLIIGRLRFLDSTGNFGLGSMEAEEEVFEYMTIPQLTSKISALPDDDIGCFAASNYSISNNRNLCQKLNAQMILSNLHAEKNNLLNICERIGVIFKSKNFNYVIDYSPFGRDGRDPTSDTYYSESIIHHRTISFNYKSSDTPITLNEDIVNDDYWINIDPYQKCKVSSSASIKILVEARYTCFPTTAVVAGELGVIPVLDRDAQNVCPSDTGDFNTADIQFENMGNVFTYRSRFNEINRQKGKYFQKYGIADNQWEEVTFPGPTQAGGGGTATRSFFIRPDRNSTDILVEVQEKYLIPNEDFFKQYIGNEKDDRGRDSKQGLYSGNIVNGLSGNVIDIIPDNVLNADNITCRPQVIPRKLRKLDTHYDSYRSDFNGNLTKALPSGGPGGPFTNIFGLWHCIDTEERKYINVPDYFKIKNEMIYRCYFGSQDNLEHVEDLDDSKDPFEWIPYEYHPEYANEGE